MNGRRSRSLVVAGAVLAAALLIAPQVALAEAPRVRFASDDAVLTLEFLDDDLLHLEFAPAGQGAAAGEALPTSPMVLKSDYDGPSQFTSGDRDGFETSNLRVEVDRQSLCATVVDRSRSPELRLARLCFVRHANGSSTLTISPEDFTHVYGLGEQFVSPGSMDGDWVGRVRSPGNEFGNAMQGWNGGVVGNAQFPVAHFLGAGSACYALFVDSTYAQVWDLHADPWRVTLSGSAVRCYIMAGRDLRDLRSDYLELTGRPPVPPKKAFGLWVSEFGFDNWSELEDKLRTLRDNRFPVDGFVLDLQWFGGVTSGSDDSRMGALTWDASSFPDPQSTIRRLWESEGIGLLTMEESYVSKGLPEHLDLEQRGFLVRDCATCEATYLTTNPWWGMGGMIDWTNPVAGAFWHDWKREPLIRAGVMGHWTDLGEPEAYNRGAWYSGVPDDGQTGHGQADVHNLYNLKWTESIWAAYARNGHSQRPYILTRSGTSGSQRYGVSMWSGDIGANLSSLAGQMNVQMHMALSGIDYFGSDIGGFYRSALRGDLDETYTQWFAAGMALDVPARPHTNNLCNCQETAPDRIGDRASNLANVRLRYQLSPYLYSLAHRAYLYGEAVFAPLVYAYPEDLNARERGSEKLVGSDLLVAIVAAEGQRETQVHLPAGDWVDYRSSEPFHSAGEVLGPFSLYPDGQFELPLLARAGAIIPLMYVDDETMNILGKRRDGTVRDELIVRVFAGEEPTQFTLYEDDGTTTAYQKGEVRTTIVAQQQTERLATVTIEGAKGTYPGAPRERDSVVWLVLRDLAGVSRVALNGMPLTQYRTRAEFEAANDGWGNADARVVVAKAGEMSVGSVKTFSFELATGRIAATWTYGAAGAPGSGAAQQTRAARLNLLRWMLVLAGCVVVIVGSLLLGAYYERKSRRDAR